MSTDGKVTCLDHAVTVADVLRFMTGSSAIPPGGFGTHIAVKFTHDQGYVRVSTCALEVHVLPLHYRTLSRFTEMMVEAIISSPGFGQV